MTPKLIEYSTSILNELRAHQVRAEIDTSTDKINGKIQRAEQMKVHTMFVIGKRDLEADAVSVRVHGKGNLGAKAARRSDRGNFAVDQRSAGLMQRSKFFRCVEIFVAVFSVLIASWVGNCTCLTIAISPADLVISAGSRRPKQPKCSRRHVTQPPQSASFKNSSAAPQRNIAKSASPAHDTQWVVTR